ncbi:hypothetical protein U9M48_027745, partial [Paspalum notatum var. saurae]
HIDPANEELPPDQPLIEKPEDEPEDPHATADHTAEEAPSNPSEEGDIADILTQIELMCMFGALGSNFLAIAVPSTGGSYWVLRTVVNSAFMLYK